MSDLSDPRKFAAAYEEIDATEEPRVANIPEEIRRLIDRDAHKEYRQSESGKWYTIKDGEFKPAED